MRALEARLGRPASWLGLLALLVYLPGFWWGAPRAQNDQSIRSWGVDDEAPIGPLAQIHNIIEPKEVQNLGYPLMHSFMVGAAYAPYLGALWLKGDFGEPSGEYPYGLADPVRSLQVLTWIAHLLSVLLGAGVVACAALAAGRLWAEREAWWAGAFALLSYPMFYYARTGNVDGPALFFVAAALVAFAGILRHGIDPRRTAWLGLWVGFACATKEQSAAVFLGIPFVLLYFAWCDRRPDPAGRAEPEGWSAAWKAFAAGLLACVLAFGFGSGLFVDPDRYFAHLAFNAERIELLRRGEIAFMTYYERDLAGSLALIRLLGGYVVDALTWPGVALAVVGIGTALARRGRAAWMLVPLATYLFVLFWATRNGQLRYMLPAALVLALFAARGLGWLLDEARGREGAVGSALRGAALAAAAWIVAAGSLRGIDLTQQMIRDSRWDATAWLESRLGPGDRIDFFGPDAKLPWLPYGVVFERANEYLGAVYEPKRGPEDAARIRRRWAELRPDAILVMPDVSSREGEPHNATLPPEVYGDLLEGRLGYDLAETFRTPRLFPWLPIPELDYPSVNPPIRVFVPREPA
ncbi:MAG: glycosyltransferase 87 family protein [Gemmatimonadota bacterium]|nr:glycosyltransferase 87 family protein [Gemmatimonadota bacterium]